MKKIERNDWSEIIEVPIVVVYFGFVAIVMLVVIKLVIIFFNLLGL